MEKTSLNPYTAILMPSLQNGEEFLADIFLSETELLPRKIDKPVILYGAGSLGRMAKDFFDYLKIPFLYVVDRNASQHKQDEYWKNIKVISPDEVGAKDKKDCLLIMCIVTAPLIKLQDELKNAGWEDIVFFYDVTEAYCNSYPLSNGWFLGKLNEEEKESIKKVFSSLADDISRAHYLQFIAWRRLRIELSFENIEINLNDRFFIPEVTSTLNDREIFIDCGAHKGAVTDKFLKLTGNKYNSIYALEPDEDTFVILAKGLNNNPNIKAQKYTLADKIGNENFYQGFDFASKLGAGGNRQVHTVTLDSLNIPATFIKMHLEGGELNALRGAINTIQKYRPIVAATIYHNSQGAWEIPLFLINSTKDYKYYMRLHAFAGTGAVFYAIPQERVQ